MIFCRSYLFRVQLVLALMLISLSVKAQLSGSVGVGGQTTNNVQTLDTIEPDRILMPAVELNYNVQTSGVSTVTLTGSYAPSFYSQNPTLSFHETSIGATGLFYLINQDDITAEKEENNIETRSKSQHSSRFLSMPMTDPSFEFSKAYAHSPLARTEIETKNDSLVDLAVSELYMLSGELDSSEIFPKGISKNKVSELVTLRDSISDVISTVADLLDSVGYSESVSEIIVGELQDLQGPLQNVAIHIQPPLVNLSSLDAAVRLLREAKPEQDFLPTSLTPSAPSNKAAPQPEKIRSLTIVPSTENTWQASAPILTLVTSTTRLRVFGYSDATIREDLEDSGATTMATSLTIPVNYTDHSGVHFSLADSAFFGGNFGGNPNDNSILTFGAAVEGLPSTQFSLRGSYDYTHTQFPFDSVYSSNENRFTFSPRLSAGSLTVLFGEAAIGFKKYLNPLIVSQVVKRPKKGDTTVSQIAGSSFDQFSFGVGLTQFLGQHWLVGGLMSFNDNPNLRAYVTTAQIAAGTRGKAIRATTQIADDEYTYNLGRYTLFADGRIWGGIDLGLDLSYEHRKYGSAVGKRGTVLDSGRTENGEFFNVSLSKLFVFDEQWIGIFDGLLLEAKLESDNVVATQSIYNYKLSELTLTSTLTF